MCGRGIALRMPGRHTKSREFVGIGDPEFDHARHLARILACLTCSCFEVCKNVLVGFGFLSTDCNQTIPCLPAKWAAGHHCRQVKRNWITRSRIELSLPRLVVSTFIGSFFTAPEARISSTASPVSARFSRHRPEPGPCKTGLASFAPRMKMIADTYGINERPR